MGSLVGPRSLPLGLFTHSALRTLCSKPCLVLGSVGTVGSRPACCLILVLRTLLGKAGSRHPHSLPGRTFRAPQGEEHGACTWGETEAQIEEGACFG